MSDLATLETSEQVDSPPPRSEIRTSHPGEVDWLADLKRPTTSLTELIGGLDIAVDAVETAQWKVLFVGSLVLRWATTNATEWKTHASTNRYGGETVAAQIGDLLLRRAPDYDNMPNGTKQRRRMENAHIVEWFAEHGIDDPEQVIKDAAHKGRTAVLAEQKEHDSTRQKKARTDAATQRRKEQHEQAERDRATREQVALAEIAREHEETEQRAAADKEAKVRRALAREPLGEPPKEPAVEPETIIELPTFDPASVLIRRPDDGEAQGESVNEDETADDPEQEPEGMPDIEDTLRQITPDPQHWNLATAIGQVIEQEGIAPDGASKPPLAVTVLLQVVDPKTQKPALYRVLDAELCVNAALALIDERRMAARLADAAD